MSASNNMYGIYHVRKVGFGAICKNCNLGYAR